MNHADEEYKEAGVTQADIQHKEPHATAQVQLVTKRVTYTCSEVNEAATDPTVCLQLGGPEARLPS